MLHKSKINKNNTNNNNNNTNVAVNSDAKGKLVLTSLQNLASRCVTVCHFNILKAVTLASLFLTHSRVLHIFSSHYRTFKDLRLKLISLAFVD